MALIRCDLRSEVLQMDSSLFAALPQDRTASDAPPKVLYLLHGLSNNCSAWVTHTHVTELAWAYNVAVIMPEVQRSFYTDMVYGPAYYTYVAEELPSLCGRLFGLSQRREDNFVAGLSMGGYGALKVGLSRPGQFAGCAGFSSAADAREIAGSTERPGLEKDIRAILGEDKHLSDNDDLFALADQRAANGAPEQKIFITCGTGDDLYQQNWRLKAHLEKLGIPFTYREWGGEHTWKFWRESIDLLFPFFFGEDKRA